MEMIRRHTVEFMSGSAIAIGYLILIFLGLLVGGYFGLEGLAYYIQH